MVVVSSWRCSPAEARDSCRGRGAETIQHMQWEYIVREFNVQDSDKILLVEEFLNEVGKDGWELVSVATTPTENFTHLIYLKRQNLVENLRPTGPAL